MKLMETETGRERDGLGRRKNHRERKTQRERLRKRDGARHGRRRAERGGETEKSDGERARQIEMSGKKNRPGKSTKED